jgi:selenide,water dikinase
MARGAGVQLAIEVGRVPQLPRAAALCAEGFTCGGTKANAAYTGGAIALDPGLDAGLVGLLHDPQTSGGLLVSVPADRCADLQAAVIASGGLCAEVIGEVVERAGDAPYLVFT